MKLYKLTDRNGQTRGGCQWGEGVTHTAHGKGDLCSRAFLHAYERQLVAVLMNVIHCDFVNPIMWQARGVKRGCKRDGQIKIGVTKLTTLRQIRFPTVTTLQRVEIAIRCALAVCDNSKFVKWANDWLSNTDRTAKAACDATWTPYAATCATARAAACGAARAATCVATCAATRDAAYEAAFAAASAARMPDLDLIAICEQVCGRKEDGR